MQKLVKTRWQRRDTLESFAAECDTCSCAAYSYCGSCWCNCTCSGTTNLSSGIYESNNSDASERTLYSSIDSETFYAENWYPWA